jgi:cyclopropane fatty-acyl-phospholipid synthase-like methyltransferase
MNELENKILNLYPKNDNYGIYKSGSEGYCSNLSKKENEIFSFIINSEGVEQAVRSVIPEYKEMIFSEKREAILELLNHSRPGVCIDYGCMWGVLSVGMAKRGHQVISIDQTYLSLNFLRSRIKEDELKNIHLIQDDIKKTKFNNIADYAIVNGVLEWIPVTGEVHVTKFHQKDDKVKKASTSPKEMQLEFLKVVYSGLKKSGKMVLSIENRHFYQYYMGRRDPHSNLLFTTFLPRIISNLISRIFHKKAYRNYIYSFNDMKKLVEEAGFSKIDIFMAYPDYHFPELILPYSNKGLSLYDKYPNKNRKTKKQKFSYYIEYFLTKWLRIKALSPAIMIIAEK